MTSPETEKNANEAAAPVAKDNPYLQRVANEEEKRRPDCANGSVDTDDEDAAAAAELAAEKKKRKQRRRRRITQAFIATLLSASVVIAIALYQQRSTRVEYGRAGNQPRVLPSPPNAGATTGRDNRTEQALQEMQHLTGENRSAGNANAQATTRDRAAHGGNANVTNSASDSSNPFDVPPSLDASHNSTTSDRSSSTVSVSTNDQPLRSQRSSEASLYVSERIEERLQPAARTSERPSTTPSTTTNEQRTEARVVVPPFGSMLPVRTIGGLYTLRSGALARLELTRDIIGNGWSMTRGTILVGTTKGGDYDRAYVAIIGFIDPESGKFVKLGGDVLGGDGTAGLKGKSRQLDSRWTRVLSQLGNAALSVTTAAVGGRSNGTVVISDGARSSLINPVSDELNGLLGAQSDGNRRTGFVEVIAGTPGYVMVTDLPATIKGTDPNAEPDVQSLALSDIDAIRPATGLSERDFAELIANGSPEEIKARLKRMSPEMRKIALAVLEH